MVCHVSGLSRSLLNRAVCDRGRDWVFSVDPGPRATLAPASDGQDGRTYRLEAEGGEIVLRFRPRFYQVHRGLASFEPWTCRIWPKSVSGWISWFAFYDKVTEKDIVDTADALSEVLLPSVSSTSRSTTTTSGEKAGRLAGQAREEIKAINTTGCGE
jgi:hypothetical protein